MPQTQIVPLNFSNLEFLDEGRINKLLAYHLQNIAQDVISRSGDKTKRRVTLEFIAQPLPDPSTGECTESSLEIECKSKTPVYRSKPYQMRVSMKGFEFNRDFADELDQQPLYKGDDG